MKNIDYKSPQQTTLKREIYFAIFESIVTLAIICLIIIKLNAASISFLQYIQSNNNNLEIILMILIIILIINVSMHIGVFIMHCDVKKEKRKKKEEIIKTT